MYKTIPLIQQRHQVRYVRSYGKVFDLIEQTTRYEIGMNGELTSSTLSGNRKWGERTRCLIRYRASVWAHMRLYCLLRMRFLEFKKDVHQHAWGNKDSQRKHPPLCENWNFQNKITERIFILPANFFLPKERWCLTLFDYEGVEK